MDPARTPQSHLSALTAVTLAAGMTCKWRVLDGDLRLRITGPQCDRGWMCPIRGRPLDVVVESLSAAVLAELVPDRATRRNRLALAA